jgi:hypothetical protein
MEDAETAARAAHDIDSTNFSVNNYVAEQLAKSPLPDLMAFQNQMAAETRALDHEMKDLVYNNYNKFISATDTIRRMRDSVGEMEASMTRLGGEMRAMGGSSALVNEHLQENRGKIESLVGVKRLLVKLEFLFELPMRLRRSMELDALAQAVRYFTTVRAVLQKYDSMPSIHAIHVEARAIMDKLRDQLRGVLKAGARAAASATSASAAKVVEAIRLLVALDEPRKPLREDFLAFQRGRLLGALAKAAERYSPAGVAPAPVVAAAAAPAAFSADSTSGTAMLSERARVLAAAAVAARAAAAAAPTSVAAARPRAPVPHAVFVQFVNRLFLDAFRYATDLYVELFEGDDGGAAAPTAAPARAPAHDDLLAFTRDVMGAYFATLRRQLSLPPPLSSVGVAVAEPDAGAGVADGKRVGAAAARGARGAAAPLSPPRPADGDGDEAEAAREKAASGLEAVSAESASSRYEAVCDALKMVLTDVRAASRLVKEACLPDRAHEAVEAILRAQLDGLFGDVRGAVVRLLLALEARVRDVVAEEARAAAGRDWAPAAGRALAALAEDASADIPTRVDDALHEAKPLILAAMRLLPDLARSFTGLVHAQVFALLSWLGAAWEAAGDAAHPSRAEWHDIVVEADVGLDGDAGGAAGGGGGAARARGAADAGAARAVRRALVNYSVPEADQNAPVPAFNGTGGGILAPEAGGRTHAFLVLLAALAKTFAHTGVTRALTTMIQSFPTRGDLVAMGIGALALDDGEGYGSMGGVPDLIRRVEAAGRELLRRFAFLHGARLAAVVRAALTTPVWTAVAEPRAVRDVVRVVLEDIAANKRLVAAALGAWDAAAMAALARFCGAEGGDGGGGGGGGGGSGGGGGGASVSSAPSAEPNPFAPTPAPATLKGPAAGASAAALSSVASSRRTGTVVCAAGLGPAAGGMHDILGARGGLSRALPVDMDRLFSTAPALRDGGGAPGFASPGPSLAGGGVGGGRAPRHILSAVGYSADSVARALLRLALKAWIEWTRAAVLGAHGLQQLQIDLAAVHMCLPVLTGSVPPPAPGSPNAHFDAFAHAASLEELIHEAALSAGERCLDNRPVEPAVMLQIATTSIANYDFVNAANAVA